MEEIKSILAMHGKSITQCRKRLQVREDAGKVLKAIQNKMTSQVMGGDIARFVNFLMEKNDLFKNYKAV